MQSQLILENPDKNALEQAVRDYVDIMDKRLAVNNEYVQQELETDEGTATYVGIQQYQAGNIDKSSLANRVPSETGALLCLVMDEIGVDDWQDSLNSQTKDNLHITVAIIYVKKMLSENNELIDF